MLLCKDNIGYKNLIYLVSRGFTEGFYNKPRIDLDLLKEHTEGLIALSACLAGAIPRLIDRGDLDEAYNYARRLSEMFGKDNFYIELQDHGLPEQRQLNPVLVKLARDLDLPLIATNDAHYLTRDDARIQDVLLCIQTNRTVDDPDRMKFGTDEFYIKSSDEMAELFSQWPEAIENTATIAERCNVEFEFGKYHLPRFEVPDGMQAYDYLVKCCNEGLARRYPDGRQDARERLEYELGVISSMGFVEYFLIVADFISFAKSHGIPVGPGRGSGAGSIVAYSLGITDIDPLKYGLLFERFLNPERVTMPDIDIDFCYQRRQEVIDYVISKYGYDHVAQIVTFGTMAARLAIRDVGRALNIPYNEVDVVAKLVPMELHMTIEHAIEVSPQLKEIYDTNEKMHELIEIAKSLEGMPRHSSTHAAGVVITNLPVDNYVPLAKNDESVVTQFSMTTLEELGLLKMDFLGLRTLTVIADAERDARKKDPDFDIGRIPDDDAETYAMLAAGKTAGVFQLESAGMTNVVTRLIPTSIEEITAAVALFRPGPMESIPRYIQGKHHRETVTYKTEALKKILDITYGCIVYQEQIMEIFRQLAGYSLGRADIVRRAMSKKKMAVLVQERKNFIEGDPEAGIDGALKRGVPREVAEELFEEMLDFANYAFNKPHAAAYAVVAYRTAYLKCHYPREFMAALMTSVIDSTVKINEYIAECKNLGISVLPPDVNESDDGFTVSGDYIRFGLVAVKNIGRGFIKSLMAERAENGPFKSMGDFCERMYNKDLNKRAMENLIRCGAFDSMGHTRHAMIAVYEGILDSISTSMQKNLEGQIDLFGSLENEKSDYIVPNMPEYPKNELLAMEKDTAGLYMSGHPMDEYSEQVKKIGAARISDIFADFENDDSGRRYFDGQSVILAGILSNVRTKMTKNNTMMAYLTLEDGFGTIEMLVFSRVLNESSAYVSVGSVVKIQGKISARDEKSPQIMVDSIRPITDADYPPESSLGSKLYIKLPTEVCDLTDEVKRVLVHSPGNDAQAILYFADTKKREAAAIRLTQKLVDTLREVLDDESVVVK